jgi:hypothetical protein
MSLILIDNTYFFPSLPCSGVFTNNIDSAMDQTCRDENQRLFRLLLKVDYELSGEDPEGQRNSVCCINLNLGFVVFLQLTSDEN